MRRYITLLLIAALLLSACAASPAPSPTPTPSAPVPSVPPAALLSQAQAALTLGDLDALDSACAALLAVYPQAAEAATARRLLAESQARRGLADPAGRAALLQTAATALQPFVAADPAALLWLGRVQAAAKAPQAADTLLRYAALNTPIAAYARLLAAQAQLDAGQAAEAARTAEAAGQAAALPRAEQAGALDLAARAYVRAEQPAEALRVLRELLDFAAQPSYRAGVLARAADLAAAQGDGAQARVWQTEIVRTAPAAPAALAAADALAADPPTDLNPADLARVYATAERWPAAIAQYDAALQAAPDDSELARLRAQALRADGQTEAALAALTELAAREDPSSRQAALDRAQLVGQEVSSKQAADDYLSYAARWDTDPLAAVALDRAAQLLDRLGDPAAVTVRQTLIERFPTSDPGLATLEQLAWAAAKAGQPEAARGWWERLAANSSGALAARATLMAARAAQTLGQPDAKPLLERARQLAPESYAAARAADLAETAATGQIDPAAPLSAADWQTLAAWAGVSAADVAREPGLERAGLLAAAGLNAEAAGEYALALETWRQDPARLLALARLATARGVPDVALAAADALRALAPAERPAAPVALTRLRYPVPYLAAVQASGVDPALYYGLLRQESRFAAGAISSAGALGVAQVMPETGHSIAAGLGVTSFASGDLLRPAVGVRFGGQYLRDQLAAGDSPLVALAAYNGGPANAARWREVADPADPDAFTAAIDFGETRAYVRTVYANAAVYRALYRWAS